MHARKPTTGHIYVFAYTCELFNASSASIHMHKIVEGIQYLVYIVYGGFLLLKSYFLHAILVIQSGRL